MQRLLIGAAAAMIAAFAATSAQAAPPAMAGHTSLGKVMVDAKGMTLYTYQDDSDGTSHCNDKCAMNWPPLKAATKAKADGDWTVIKRDDGSMQWAYKGQPLYLWVKDKKPGDVTGEGVHDEWHVVKLK